MNRLSYTCQVVDNLGNLPFPAKWRLFSCKTLCHRRLDTSQRSSRGVLLTLFPLIIELVFISSSRSISHLYNFTSLQTLSTVPPPPFVISGSQTNRCANHWESEMANGFSMANRFYNSPGTIRHSPCIYSLMVGGGHWTGFVAVGGWITWMETRGFTQQLFWICISPLKVFSSSSSSSPCCWSWSDNRQEEEKLAIMLIVIAKIHKEEIVLGLDGTRERAAVLGRQLWRFSYQSLYCLLVEWGCVGKVWPT